MKIIDDLVIKFKTVLYRDKLAGIGLPALISSNFNSCCSFYRGFFGEPLIDNELMTANKCLSIKKTFMNDFRDCNDAIKRKGWELIYSKTNDYKYVKIIMIPSSDIRSYMNGNIFGNSSEKINLYKKMGGNII